MNKKLQRELIIGILAIVGFIIFLFTFGSDAILFILPEIPEAEIFFQDTYAQIGLLTIFVYEFIPDGFKFISDAGFYGNLLERGISPEILIIIPALGHLGGQLIMYSIGRFSIGYFNKNKKNFAGPEHVMHKHKILIFFIVPFGGMLGTFIMILAGHQKINFLKVAPILMIANIIHMALFVYPFMFEFGLG